VSRLAAAVLAAAVLAGGALAGCASSACDSAGCVGNRVYPFMHWSDAYGHRGSPLATSRVVSEVDCTRPMADDVRGNIRCR
jgi:hypothetical protein